MMMLLRFFVGICALAGVAMGEWEPRLTEDFSNFSNPERGFYSYQNLAEPNDQWSQLRGQGITLLNGKVKLEEYREEETLPEDYLKRLQTGFDRARAEGLKVIVRANYGHRGPGGDYRSYQDPGQKIVLAHMEQLREVWQKNADVIALFEAGFVGPWGEWHSTEIASEPELQRQFFRKILGTTPKERMVVLRYPELKRSIFQRREALTADEAYSGTNLARTGHHNDCFLSSPNDVGTYGRGIDSRPEEVKYLAQETNFTVYGGETCQLHEFSDADRTLIELDLLNASYLNSAYHPKVLEKWKKQDCFAEVERRLGARFVVRKAEVKEDEVKIEIENVGFAALYNERAVFLMRKKGEELLAPIEVEVDPRSWKSGHKIELNVDAQLSGVTQIGLWLPDFAEGLRKDSRYCIRFANKGTWEQATGVNWILTR